MVVDASDSRGTDASGCSMGGDLPYRAISRCSTHLVPVLDGDLMMSSVPRNDDAATDDERPDLSREISHTMLANLYSFMSIPISSNNYRSVARRPSTLVPSAT